MTGLQYEFRECQNADCRFRYPAPIGNAPLGPNLPAADCPKCGAQTVFAAHASLTPEPAAASRPVPTNSDAVLLDNLRSAWNVGSILRTADGAGLHRIYLCGITPTPAHPRVTRTALGAQRTVEWSWHANALLLARELLHKGYHLWALESIPQAESITAMNRLPTDPPVVLIVGNEIAGIDPELLGLAQTTFSIPMRGNKQSLNAAVAFGIAAYQLEKIRSASG